MNIFVEKYEILAGGCCLAFKFWFKDFLSMGGLRLDYVKELFFLYFVERKNKIKLLYGTLR